MTIISLRVLLTKARRFACALLVVLGASGLSGPASATHVGDVYFFGDSLSDTGNVFAFTGFVSALRPDLIPAPLPGTPYFNGRFSSGPVWVETLADELGLPGASLPAGLATGPLFGGVFLPGPGNNFAIAGARTGVSGLLDALGVPGGLNAQVDTYLQNSGGQADPNALYVVVAGGNDVRDAALAQDAILRQAIARLAAERYREAVGKLLTAGARMFLVSNINDIGGTPEARLVRNNAAAATEASLAFNQALEAEFAPLSQEREVKLARFDLFSLFEAVARDATERGGRRFGITDAATPCFAGFAGSTGGDCETSLFSDDLHPTAAGHRILGLAAAACHLGGDVFLTHFAGGRDDILRLRQFCAGSEGRRPLLGARP